MATTVRHLFRLTTYPSRTVVSTDWAYLKIGKKIFITADHTKFHRVPNAFASSLGTVQTILTDDQAPADLVA